jgi:hypothetical protein
MARTLTTRVQNILIQTPKISGQVTQTELVSQINQIFQRQHQINTYQSNLTNANFITSMANYSQNKHLTEVIQKGHQHIITLQNTVQTLEQQISCLDLDLEQQRQESSKLNHRLQKTQQVLKVAIVTYREELDKQKIEINTQSEKLDKLLLSKQRTDLIVDSGLVLVCLMVVRNSITNSAVNLLGGVLPSKARKTFNRLFRLFWFILLFWRGRNALLFFGLHGGVGSINHYRKYIFGDFGVFKISNTLELPPKPFTHRSVVDE